MRCPVRFCLPTIFALASLCLVGSTGMEAPTHDPFIVRLGFYGPRSEVRVSQPELTWQIWAEDESARISISYFELDGKSMQAQYDSVRRAVVGIPEERILSGHHHVFSRVTFENGLHFEKSWDFHSVDQPLSTLPVPTQSQSRTAMQVSAIRHRLGLGEVTENARLDFAATKHSEYLSINRTTGHGELPDGKAFWGKSGSERLEAAGFTGNSYEDVAFGCHSSDEAVDNLFNAPYHRIPFLMPGRPGFGSAYTDLRFTLEFSGTEEIGTTVSPYDGEWGVPCQWRNSERPDPMRYHPDAGNLTGYPIVLAHFAPEGSHLTKIFAWLTGPDGKDVPIWINSPKNDDILSNAAILIPKQPLRPHSTYSASFDGRDLNGRVVRAEVTFQTGRQ